MNDARLRNIQREGQKGDLASKVKEAYALNRVRDVAQATERLREALQIDVSYSDARKAMAEINPLGWTGLVRIAERDGMGPCGLTLIEPGKAPHRIPFGTSIPQINELFYVGGELHMAQVTNPSVGHYDGQTRHYVLYDGKIKQYRETQNMEQIFVWHAGKRMMLSRPWGIVDFSGAELAIEFPQGCSPFLLVGNSLVVERFSRSGRHYFQLWNQEGQREGGLPGPPVFAEDQRLYFNDGQGGFFAENRCEITQDLLRFPRRNTVSSELDLRFAANNKYTEVGIHVLDALGALATPTPQAPVRYHAVHSYQNGQPLEHSVFGQGVVVSSTPKSIEVDFGEKGVRKLVHRQKQH